jgi:NitT/TauT family transport system permease protein
MKQLVVSRLLFLAACLIAWELVAEFVLSPFWISRPSAIASRLVELAMSGDLVWHASITILETLLGLLLGLVIGVPIGLALGIWRNVANVVDPFVLGLYSLPRVALAPLFIIWFGIGLFSKVMLAFSLVVFVFMLNVQEGLRNVNPELIQLMRTMRASRGYVTRKVLLPATVTWIFAALRIGIGLALIGAVISELIGASRGLGWYIEHSAGSFDTTGVFAGLVVLVVLAMFANTLVQVCERRALRWRAVDLGALA